MRMRTYTREPLVGWKDESRRLVDSIQRYKTRLPFDFSGHTIVPPAGIDGREVFIKNGDTMHGLIPSYIHLQETFELMGDVLHWRRQGWLKRLVMSPWKVW